MRGKLNLTGSADQRIGQKLRMSAMPLSGVRMSGVRMSGVPISRMPLEWMDAGSWRLPSGKALAEFALQAGFLAPLLLKSDRFSEPARESDAQPVHGALSERTKHFGKGGN
jgi:hypothetical protein